MAVQEQVIMQKLDSIITELDFIKEHMVDKDSFLSVEDKVDLEKARVEWKTKTTKSSEQLRKELGF